MTVRWIDKRAPWDQFLQKIGRRLDGHSVEVGITEDQNPVYENGYSAAEVLFFNEFGAPKAHIPERPAIRDAIRENDNFRKAIRAAVRAIPFGLTPEEALAHVGQEAVQAIQASIEKYNSPRNAESTIRKKGEDNPLINSRRLQQAIHYRIIETAKKNK